MFFFSSPDITKGSHNRLVLFPYFSLNSSSLFRYLKFKSMPLITVNSSHNNSVLSGCFQFWIDSSLEQMKIVGFFLCVSKIRWGIPFDWMVNSWNVWFYGANDVFAYNESQFGRHLTYRSFGNNLIFLFWWLNVSQSLVVSSTHIVRQFPIFSF